MRYALMLLLPVFLTELSIAQQNPSPIPGDDRSKAQIKQDNALVEAVMGGDSPWGTCTVVIDRCGHYQFEFSYEPPPRLNGVYDDTKTSLRPVPMSTGLTRTGILL